MKYSEKFTSQGELFTLEDAKREGGKPDGRFYWVGGNTHKWYPVWKFPNGRIAYVNGADLFYSCPCKKNIK